MGVHLFASGTLRIHLHGFQICCKDVQRIFSGVHSVPIYLLFNAFIHVASGAPCEVIKSSHMIQGVLHKTSEDFHNMFYNGRPLGVHRIPIGISLATPVILQWAPLQFNFVVSMHVAWVPLLTISLDILSF